jgi:hypothetical protein
MSKSSAEGTPAKTASVSNSKTTRKSAITLSDAALAAAIESIKTPATPDKKVTPPEAMTGTKVASSKTKRTAVKSAAPKKQPAPSHLAPSEDMIKLMIEEAAYYLAEKRHFAPGFEKQDWLEAKHQIMSLISGAKRPMQ